MVKLHVAGEKDVEDDPEPEIWLKLKKYDARIEMIAMDKNGKYIPGSHILSVYQSGTLTRHGGLSDDLGFELDGEGRIKENDCK